jgi:hypothetical protein
MSGFGIFSIAGAEPGVGWRSGDAPMRLDAVSLAGHRPCGIVA